MTDIALSTYALPAKGVGLYTFVETTLDANTLNALAPHPKPEQIQPVTALPRAADGSPRMDALHLIAANRLDELAELQKTDPTLTTALAPIIKSRLNLTDRVLKR